MKKKVKLPQKRTQISDVIVLPSVENLLQDALSVIGNEIVRYKHKSEQGRTLESAEARILQGYVRSLVDLSKESREIDKSVDTEGMSDEELLEYFLSGKSEHELRSLFQKLINKGSKDG